MGPDRESVVSRQPDAAEAAARRGPLRYYIDAQSTSVGRYVLEQALFFFLQGIPSLVRVGLRALAYRLILQSDGLPVVESHVRLCQPANIHLGRQVYLDHSVYLHACPQGIFIGDETFVMHGTILHVFNFRELPNAGIWVGRNCFIGERCVIRGQGGVHIGGGLAIDRLLAYHACVGRAEPTGDTGRPGYEWVWIGYAGSKPRSGGAGAYPAASLS